MFFGVVVGEYAATALTSLHSQQLNTQYDINVKRTLNFIENTFSSFQASAAGDRRWSTADPRGQAGIPVFMRTSFNLKFG